MSLFGMDCRLLFRILQMRRSRTSVPWSIDFCRWMLILYVMIYVVAMPDVGCLFIQLSEFAFFCCLTFCHSLPCFIECEVLDMLFEDETTWIQIFFIWIHLLLELVPTRWIDFGVSGRQAVLGCLFEGHLVMDVVITLYCHECFWFVYGACEKYWFCMLF